MLQRHLCAWSLTRAPLVAAGLTLLASAIAATANACEPPAVRARGEQLVAEALRGADAAKNDIAKLHDGIGRAYAGVLVQMTAWIRAEQFGSVATDDLARRIDAALDFERPAQGGDEIVSEAVYDVGTAVRLELDYLSRAASMEMTRRVLGPNAGGDPLAVLEALLRSRDALLKRYAAWVDSLKAGGCAAGADAARAWAYLAYAYLPEDAMVGGLAPDATGEPAPDTEPYWRAYSAFGINRKPLWQGTQNTWWMMLHGAVPADWPGAEAAAPARARVIAAVKARLEALPLLRETVGPLPAYRGPAGTASGSAADSFDPFTTREPSNDVSPPL